MATSKTLTPTNVTIQIPEFTDQPDQRVNSNCIDKEADAINALNNKIANISIGLNFLSDAVNVTNGSFTTMQSFAVPANGMYIIVATAIFSSDNNGMRILVVDTSSTAENSGANHVLATGRAVIEKVTPMALTTSDTVYIRVYQNSGNTMSVRTNYRIVRLK